MKKQLKKLKVGVLKMDLKKVKLILKRASLGLKLEKQRSLAYLRWLKDMKTRHKLDVRNRVLFRKYVALNKRFKLFENKHLRRLAIVRH